MIKPGFLKILLVIFAAISLLSDQATKFLSKKIPTSGIFLSENKFISIGIHPTLNDSLAFSLPLPQVLIIFLNLIVMGIIVYLLYEFYKKQIHSLTIILSFMLGAALSNLLDRLICGGVVDFISVSIYNYHWPIFNIADTIIVLCTFIFILLALKKKAL